MEYNGTVFEGMKLAGTVMIVSGFLLVLLPSNWTDYIARFLTFVQRLFKNVCSPMFDYSFVFL